MFYFYAASRQLLDLDHLRLQFLGIPNMWLGCTFDVCDVQSCPTQYQYWDFNSCVGEVFQIIGNSYPHAPIVSGQHVMFKWPNWHNT